MEDLRTLYERTAPSWNEDPSDGDALYGRASVHGWSDKWGVERRLLEDAIALAPDHPDIRKAVRTRDAYHAGACSSRTFGLRPSPVEA